MLVPPRVPPSKSNILTLPPPSPVLQPSRQTDDLAMLKGSLTVVSATDLLEWLCCNGRTGTLRLHDAAKLQAQVVILSGQIVDATWQGLRGLDALCEIVACEHGSFDLVPASPDAERTLHGNWQTLLLSATQILDERNHEDSQSNKGHASAKRKTATQSASRSSEHLFALPFPDEPKTRPNIDAQDAQAAATAAADDAGPKPVTAQEWIDQGFSALRAGDNDRARACWTTALAMQPNDRTLRFNLRKLDKASAPSTKTK
jgi:hypothetical protein